MSCLLAPPSSIVPPRRRRHHGRCARALRRVVHFVRLGARLVAEEHHRVLLSSSFFSRGCVALTCPIQSKMRRKRTSGFLPYHASYGVMPSTLLVKERLRMKTAVSTASPQNMLGT